MNAVTGFARRSEGQALMLVGLGMTIVLAALALAVDWGHGVVQRRSGANEAASAALAVGRLLATSVIDPGDGKVSFAVSQETAWCRAAEYRDKNHRPAVGEEQRRLTVSFSPDGVSWTTIERATCPFIGTGTPIPRDTSYVRVGATTTYRPLFGVLAKRDVTAGDSARVRIASLPLLEDLPPAFIGGKPGRGVRGWKVVIWPITRHFDPTEYVRPCGPECDPNSVAPLQFWPPPKVFGLFKGLVDPSHKSLRHLNSPHQSKTLSDYAGSVHADPPTALLPNRSITCTLLAWDTNGTSSASDSLGCNVANWFYYGFRGHLALSTDWSDPTWDPYLSGAKRPSALGPSRASCKGPSYFIAPSCVSVSSYLGDWLETAPGDLDANMIDRMRELIATAGRETTYSGAIVAAGPNAANRYGKALVVYVALWDCAERFDSGDWNLIKRGRCGDLDTDPDSLTPARVHLFTIVPFLFYEGLVTQNAVQAHWGGLFGEPGRCRTVPTACAPVNPFLNTAFLVPDS